MARPLWQLVPLFVVLLLSPTCGGNTVSQSPSVEFSHMMSHSYQHIRTYNFDTNQDMNGDGQPDTAWVVLYRFDLPTNKNVSRVPVWGTVYRIDNNHPADLISHPLALPDDQYLCEYNCTFSDNETAVSALNEKQLIFRDRHNSTTTRLSIFYWDAGTDSYKNAGFFAGDRVTLEQADRVTVWNQIPPVAPLSRSQLAYVTTYEATWDANQVLEWYPRTVEIRCLNGLPNQVEMSPYPEKVILALYDRYADAITTRPYFTDTGWQQLGECWAGTCGCSAPRPNITHVYVHDLTLREEQTDSCAVISAHISCLARGQTTEENVVWWRLLSLGGGWRLDNAVTLTSDQDMPSPEQLALISCSAWGTGNEWPTSADDAWQAPPVGEPGSTSP